MSRLSPSHRNQTGFGCGVPSLPAVTSKPRVSARSRRSVREPNSVSRSRMSLTGAECKGHSFTISAKPPVSLFYRVAYLVGFKPWDRGVSPPELVAVVEGPDHLPPRKAPPPRPPPRTNTGSLAPPGPEGPASDLTSPPPGTAPP